MQTQVNCKQTLLMCIWLSVCATVCHTHYGQNNSDNLSSYLPDSLHCSDVVCGVSKQWILLQRQTEAIFITSNKVKHVCCDSIRQMSCYKTMKLEWLSTVERWWFWWTFYHSQLPYVKRYSFSGTICTTLSLSLHLSYHSIGLTVCHEVCHEDTYYEMKLNTWNFPVFYFL